MENLAPSGFRSPDRPARSQSLYRLSYPSPLLHKHRDYFLWCKKPREGRKQLCYIATILRMHGAITLLPNTSPLLTTRSVNKVMRLIQYNSVLTFKLQIEFVPFKIVPLGGYTPPETLFPLFVATLVVANRNRF